MFGAWCPDSLQHVPVMWKALAKAAPPIEVHNVSVDRSKTLPPGLDPKIDDLRYVPTLVVHRDGVEVGRVVESAPHGVVEDVLRLLTGKTRGVVSGRSDL